MPNFTIHNRWTSTRGGTPLGDESLQILDFFEAHIAHIKMRLELIET